jgi:hypothetical protein
MSYNTPWHLTMRQGPYPGKVYPLNEGVVTIGRSSDNLLVIDDPRVSRHHVRLSLQQDGVVVEDLNSANGTWVNNMKITTPVRVQNGDFINLGPEIQLELVTSSHQDQETMLAAPGQMVPAAPVYAPVQTTPTAETASAGSGNWLTMGVIGALGVVIIILLLIAGGLLLYRGQTMLSASAVTFTPTPTILSTATEAPTYTPYPTYTTVPTEASTATPYPTYTPVPTEPPTATPYPTYTPFPTEPPTATPYPTYTPAPAKVVVVQSTQPPATPTSPVPPTPTSAPLYTISLGNNVHYEPWGNPGDPEGCKGPYDDRIEVRRFYAQVLLTNNSTRFIGEEWGPTFISASGAGLPTCVFYYNNLVVEPGETIDVTYGTHLQVGDYVKTLVFDIQGYTEAVCLNPGGQQIPCQ